MICYAGILSVLRAVQLDYETTLLAAKIDDQISDWKLGTKLEAAKLACANMMPQLLLGGSRITADYACELVNVLAT